MSELYERIVAQRGTLGKLAERVPGFRGYQDLRDRRAADRMLREYVVNQLDNRLARYNTTERRMMDATGIAYTKQSAEAKRKLQTYRDQVNTAAPGYSGFFAAMDVDADALEALYAFDEAQMRYLAQLDDALAVFEAAVGVGSEGDVSGALDGVYAIAAEASEAFTLRDDVLSGLNKRYPSGQ